MKVTPYTVVMTYKSSVGLAKPQIANTFTYRLLHNLSLYLSQQHLRSWVPLLRFQSQLFLDHVCHVRVHIGGTICNVQVHLASTKHIASKSGVVLKAVAGAILMYGKS